MQRLNLLFQGTYGSFSSIAAQKYSVSQALDVELLPVDRFEDIFQAVQESEENLGILPLENSLAGSVLSNYDLLEQYEVAIIGELFLPVRHFLLSKADAIQQVEYVTSHPQALQQCSKFLERHQLATRLAENTAIAAKSIANSQEKIGAAIASEACATIYDLNILANNIENNSLNTTRFAIIRKNPLELELKPGIKCSMLIRAAHKPGSLLKTVQVLAEEGGNLTKLESRPVPSEPFTYTFYIDFECTVFPTKIMERLKETVPILKVLGYYPSTKLPS
jgi:prephenate dehydratase